mmetsp:Transcript_20054/g.38859  ORF Transcript_20054/g.38859 Transcript_20054/m.38859 type:complete len:190 (+) Transcript_20054:88-657(+)
MKKLISEKKIKYWGLSNETTWGVCQFLNACRKHNVPPPVSIQNSYSLLHRNFEYELAEACDEENANIGLLPWSVLAGGRLTGKYEGGKKPEKSRHALFPKFQNRYFRDQLDPVIAKYKAIADACGVSLTVLALAFYKSRVFIPSTIIGATTLKQLEENIDAFSVVLPKVVMDAIDKIHNLHPNPSNFSG